ncbi:MAG: hypothetical protein OQK25_06455, partial [Gammaproteobacteria bacterium]|nr:hypothetical protein [Gammaproteobacteria bacterium]
MSLLTNGHPQEPPSIRSRYIRLTLLLGLLVISIVVFFYSDLISSNRKIASDYVEINEKMASLDRARSNLVDIYRSINLFLLDPSHGNYAEATKQQIVKSIENTADLILLLQQEQGELSNGSIKLQNDFHRLQNSVTELIETRMDVTRQYPGMAISAFGMTEPQQAVSNNLLILLEEIESGELEPQSAELYIILLKTHALWLNQISQLRIYLANRFAAFSDDILVTQATSLIELHNNFIQHIDKLKLLYANEDSFEGTAATERIREDSTLWLSLFHKVRIISESDIWRSDNRIMNFEIIPLTDEISASILEIEDLL